MDETLERYADLDRRLVETAKGIKVLTSLDWPPGAGEEFLRGWRSGKPSVPSVAHPRHDFGERIAALRDIARDCDPDHPVGRYIRRTAESYVTAARMLESRGTPAFTELSGALYGRPADDFGAPGLTNLDAAGHFIESTDDLAADCSLGDEDLCLLPDYIATRLREPMASFFKDHPVEVVVDPDLAAKAAAGAFRLRLRGSTCFTPMDPEQLLQHEVFVHTATKLNGRLQPHLKSLGLGAPRTACAQEGLATLAELITDTMDLGRLRRLALRIRAIQRALDGADFIEVFRFFLEAGQSLHESFQSARRIFRGGDPRGGVVFTKDVVYVKGLVFTHTFLRKAIESRKFEYPHCSSRDGSPGATSSIWSRSSGAVSSPRPGSSRPGSPTGRAWPPTSPTPSSRTGSGWGRFGWRISGIGADRGRRSPTPSQRKPRRRRSSRRPRSRADRRPPGTTRCR